MKILSFRLSRRDTRFRIIPKRLNYSYNGYKLLEEYSWLSCRILIMRKKKGGIYNE